MYKAVLLALVIAVVGTGVTLLSFYEAKREETNAIATEFQSIAADRASQVQKSVKDVVLGKLACGTLTANSLSTLGTVR